MSNSSNHQPRPLGRTPGNHTPRHVQWASAIDDDEIAGRQRDRDRDLESDVASTHELDEAGLDVCTVYSLNSCSQVLLFTANRLSNTNPCSRTPSHRLGITPSGYPYIFPTVAAVTIRYALLGRVVHATFSKTSLI